MITKKDAISFVITIAEAAKREIGQYNAVNYDPARTTAIRGTVFRTLDDIWYEILTLRVRDQFHVEDSPVSNRDNFLNIARQILND